MTRKLFGREPTLWIAVINAVVILLGTFGFSHLTGQQAALFVVAINALFGVVNAWTVRPISPVAFTYAIGSIIAVGAAYGFDVPQATVAGLNALVIPLLALLSRDQVEPQDTKVSNS